MRYRVCKMPKNLRRWFKETDIWPRAESCVVVVNEIGGFAYEANPDVPTSDRATTGRTGSMSCRSPQSTRTGRKLWPSH